MPKKATCSCGSCAKCKRRIYMREFYARNRETVIARVKRYRKANLEKIRAYDRARGFRVYDPQKIVARNAARVVPLQPCEVCGKPGERHHEDYSKPLDVRFLCREHHGIEHRKAA